MFQNTEWDQKVKGVRLMMEKRRNPYGRKIPSSKGFQDMSQSFTLSHGNITIRSYFEEIVLYMKVYVLQEKKFYNGNNDNVATSSVELFDTYTRQNKYETCKI